MLSVPPIPSGVSPRVGVELAQLVEGGQRATFHSGLWNGAQWHFVVYHSVPVPSAGDTVPAAVDVIVPVPPGYPAAMIDLAGLSAEDAFLGQLKGGNSVQGEIATEDGRRWRLASYHPHTNGGGPPWNPMRHGFHTYYDHVLAWLGRGQ